MPRAITEASLKHITFNQSSQTILHVAVAEIQRQYNLVHHCRLDYIYVSETHYRAILNSASVRRASSIH